MFLINLLLHNILGDQMLFGVERKLIAGGEINLLFTFQLKNKKKLTESIRFKIK